MTTPSGQTAYIVDDDDAVRDSMKFLLESNGIAAREFSSAGAFLAVAHADIACLILDLHMPEMSGLDMLRHLRARGMTVPVIVISGRRDAETDARVKNLGVLAVLSKPFDDGALLALIRQTLASA